MGLSGIQFGLSGPIANKERPGGHRLHLLFTRVSSASASFWAALQHGQCGLAGEVDLFFSSRAAPNLSSEFNRIVHNIGYIRFGSRAAVVHAGLPLVFPCCGLHLKRTNRPVEEHDECWIDPLKDMSY